MTTPNTTPLVCPEHGEVEAVDAYGDKEITSFAVCSICGADMESEGE